jgi:hypothetical protein
MITRLAVAARDDALKSPALAGFDPTWLLNILNVFFPGVGSLFTGCFPSPTPPTPAIIKQELSAPSVYDPATSTYLPHALNVGVRHAKAAAIQTGSGRRSQRLISDAQAQAIAIAGFNQARTGDDNMIQEQLDAN